MVEFLVKRGASINATDAEGVSTYHKEDYFAEQRMHTYKV